MPTYKVWKRNGSYVFVPVPECEQKVLARRITVLKFIRRLLGR